MPPMYRHFPAADRVSGSRCAPFVTSRHMKARIPVSRAFRLRPRYRRPRRGRRNMGQALRIVALGDSVTAGSPFSGVTPETCFVPLSRQRLAAAGMDLEWLASALDGVDAAYA